MSQDSQSNASDLGPIKSEWRAGSCSHTLLIGICGTLLGVFAVLTVNFMWCGPGDSFRRGEGVFFACMSTLLLVGLIYFVRGLRWRLLLYENGFVLQRDGTVTVLWDEIKHLREASFDLGGLDMRIETEAGRKVKLDAVFRDSQSLAHSIRRPINSRLLAKAETQLQSSAPVNFGSVRILKSGLDNGKELILWNELDSIGLKHTGKCYKIVIRKIGKTWPWYEHIVPFFPNVVVFFNLIRRFAPTKLEQDNELRRFFDSTTDEP